MLCGSRSLPPHPSAPLSWGSASGASPVEPAVSLADGRGGLRLTEVALAAGPATLPHQAAHHAAFDLLQVVCLSAQLGLQQADVRLIPAFLLMQRGEEGHQDSMKHKQKKTKTEKKKEITQSHSEILDLCCLTTGFVNGGVFLYLILFY